jgi:hypothetical protein
MTRISWFVVAAILAGCINGAPLPPSPASSLAVVPNPDRAAQDAVYIGMAQNYLRAQGRDPTQATYFVHRTPRREDERIEEAANAAVVEVDFLNGSVWHLAINREGDLTRLTTR